MVFVYIYNTVYYYTIKTARNLWYNFYAKTFEFSLQTDFNMKMY